MTEIQRHHTGHSIGLEGHEAPFIDKGAFDVIEENMVSHDRAGLYVPVRRLPPLRHRGRAQRRRRAADILSARLGEPDCRALSGRPDRPTPQR